MCKQARALLAVLDIKGVEIGVLWRLLHPASQITERLSFKRGWNPEVRSRESQRLSLCQRTPTAKYWLVTQGSGVNQYPILILQGNVHHNVSNQANLLRKQSQSKCPWVKKSTPPWLFMCPKRWPYMWGSYSTNDVGAYSSLWSTETLSGLSTISVTNPVWVKSVYPKFRLKLDSMIWI